MYKQEMDARWGAFYPPHFTFEQFQGSALPRLGLVRTCDTELLNRYRVLHKLMAFSFYEYEFYDVVAAQMSAMIETALAIRYKIDVGQDWHLKGKGIKPARILKNLIEWAKDYNLLEFEQQQLDLLRQTRNYFAHPMRHSFGGGTHRFRIEEILVLINNLFDPNFQTRRKIASDIDHWFNALKSNRFELVIKEKTFPLTSAAVLFVDATSKNPQIHLGCFLCADLSLITDGVPKTLQGLAFTNVTIADDAITGLAFDPPISVEIRKASDQSKVIIENWRPTFVLIPNWK